MYLIVTGVLPCEGGSSEPTFRRNFESGTQDVSTLSLNLGLQITSCRVHPFREHILAIFSTKNVQTSCKTKSFSTTDGTPDNGHRPTGQLEEAGDAEAHGADATPAANVVVNVNAAAPLAPSAAPITGKVGEDS